MSHSCCIRREREENIVAKTLFSSGVTVRVRHRESSNLFVATDILSYFNIPAYWEITKQLP